MANEMRDRLVELVETAKKEWWEKSGRYQTSKAEADYIADHLIENGVVVPPCKVGGTVYITYGNEVTKGVLTRIVRDNLFTFYDVWVENERYTYTVGDEEIFLTKSEAEATLKEMRGGNA